MLRKTSVPRSGINIAQLLLVAERPRPVEKVAVHIGEAFRIQLIQKQLPPSRGSHWSQVGSPRHSRSQFAYRGA
jgi:hypothetical protein